MFKYLVIGITAAGMIGGTLPHTACAQEASAAQEQEHELEVAREQLEQARRELEKAAREVAELSGRSQSYAQFLSGNAGFYATGLRGPLSAELGILIEDGDEGVEVTAVTPGGPAADAGVAVGDVITAIDSTTLPGAGSETQRLIEHMRNVDAGQNVVLHLSRDGAAREITVTAREPEQGFAYWTGPGREVIMRAPRSPRAPGTRVTVVPGGNGTTWIGPGTVEHWFGGRWNELELVTLTPGLGSYFGATQGLLVVRAPDEVAMGLQEGDVILEIGGRAPTSPEHAMRILMSFEPGETLTLAIMRRQRRESVEYVVPGSRIDG